MLCNKNDQGQYLGNTDAIVGGDDWVSSLVDAGILDTLQNATFAADGINGRIIPILIKEI